MGVQQPHTRHELIVQERRAKAIRRASIVVAIVLVGVAVYFVSTLSGDTSAPVAGTNLRPPTSAAHASTAANLVQAMNGTLTGSPPPEASATEPAQMSTAAVGSIPPALAASVASCQARWRLESVALADADRSLSQWRQHLQIMNDLQDGRISLATAKAQWPITTYKAADHEVAFRSADAALASSPALCAVDDSATGRAADAIRTCAASMKVVDNALVKARVAIAPWERHLKDQTHFAMGMMTAAAAEAAWRVMWKTGLDTLPPYDAVAHQALAAVCPVGG